MASIRYYQNGAGGTSGADLAVLKPAHYSGNIWYVHKSGTDAASPAGLERSKPLATVGQAYTNAAADDAVVFLPGHTQNLAVSLVLNKAGLCFVSEGTGAQRAAFTCTGAVAMFDVTAAGMLFDNIYFPASTAAAVARIRIGAAFGRVDNCSFDCGASDTLRALSFVTGASQGRVSGTNFTAVAATPAIGLEIINAMTDLELDDVTFDAGSFSWSDYAFKGTAAVTRLHAKRMNHLAGSHAILAAGTTGKYYTKTLSGDSRIDWTP